MKKYRIVKLESGYFEIQKRVKKRKLTFFGFKKYKRWEKVVINYWKGDKWRINLFTSKKKAKEFINEMRKK